MFELTVCEWLFIFRQLYCTFVNPKLRIICVFQNLGKKIPLANAEISDTNMDKRQFAFRIKPKHNGRTFYMQAENELKQQDWMQAICFAKAAGRHGDASQACVIQ